MGVYTELNNNEKLSTEQKTKALNKAIVSGSFFDAELLNELIESMELDGYTRQQNSHKHGVVRPEVECAKMGELLPASDGEANERAAKKLNCIVWNMCGKKHPECTGQDCCG